MTAEGAASMATRKTSTPPQVGHVVPASPQHLSQTGRQSALAASLPQEILTRIMELAVDVEDHWDPDDDERIPPISALSVLTAVCKAWVQPARIAFYRNISGTALYEAAQVVLFYEVLQHSSPPLGILIRKFDPGEIFKLGGNMAFLRTVEAMPNLEDLSVYLHQIRELSRCKNWNSIKALTIQQEGSSDGISLADLPKAFPSQLSSITVAGKTSLFSSGSQSKWAAWQLPNITSFAIIGPQLSILGFGHAEPPHHRILPYMPNLESLKLRQVIRANHLQSWSDKVILEVAQSIRTLSVQQWYKWGSFPLTTSLASHMKRLERFEYEGSAGEGYNDSRISAGCFPPTLRQVDISWSGSVQLGFDLLALLDDSAFLPNLSECPRVVHSGSAEGTPDTSRDERVMLITDAACTYKRLRKRPKISRDSPFRLENTNSDRDIYYLPSPLPYLLSLAPETRQLLEELQDAGQIADYIEERRKSGLEPS